MKKKIKDLTFKECKKICVRHSCQRCPLDIPHSNTCHCIALDQGTRLHINEEREVEIDGSDND